MIYIKVGARYQVTEDGDYTVPNKDSIIKITRIHIDSHTGAQTRFEYIMTGGLPPEKYKYEDTLYFTTNSTFSKNLRNLIDEDRERILNELGIK